MHATPAFSSLNSTPSILTPPSSPLSLPLSAFVTNFKLLEFSRISVKCSQQLCQKIRDDCLGRTIDMVQLYKRATFNIIGHVGFGVEFDAILGPWPDVSCVLYDDRAFVPTRML